MGICGITRASPVWAVLCSAWFWVGVLGWSSGLRGEAFWWIFSLGFVSYSFTEFFIHYVLFHIIIQRLPRCEGLYFKVHGYHHRYPAGYDRVVLPLAQQWVLVVTMTSLYWACTPLGLSRTLCLGSGMMLSYSLYEITHLYGHEHPWLCGLKFLEPAKAFHLHHHYVDSKRAQGFSSPVWDLLCGTLPTKSHALKSSVLAKKAGDGRFEMSVDAPIVTPLAAEFVNPFQWRRVRGVASFLAYIPLPVPLWNWWWMYLAKLWGEYPSPPFTDADWDLVLPRVATGKQYISDEEMEAAT